MVRAYWDESEYHRELWRQKDITVLITQSGTLDITRLTLESLLNFYPDIPVFVVNNSPVDPSADYLHYKASKVPNLTIWDREGLNSHGSSMDEAIRQFITTKYILTLDSDIIVERGGWIELMLEQMEKENLFATGSLMLVTDKNDGCGAPFDEEDILRYAHPSCSIYNREMYLTMKPFCNHGAPCCYTFQDAKKKELKTGFFQIDKYVAHLSGSSWCIPRTIWPDDHNVKLKPFITFIVTTPQQYYTLLNQSDHDFDMVTLSNLIQTEVIIHDGQPKKDVSNKRYGIRFNVIGDYVCYAADNMSVDFIKHARLRATEAKDAKEIDVGGVMLYKREWWQYKYVF